MTSKDAGKERNNIDTLKCIEQPGTMESILNGMDALITVCDPETFQILFINDAIRDYFGIKESSVGKICYEVLQKRSAPCLGCPYQRLLDEPEVILHWEHREFVKNSILQKTARLIDWPGGKKAHLEYAIDITPLVHAEEKLERRGRMLDALNLTSKIFLTQREEMFADTMLEGFASISGISNIDRISVSQNEAKSDGLYATQLYRWNRETGTSITPLDELKDSPYTHRIPRWEGILKSGGCINGPVRLMPEAPALLQFGCVSVLAVPVFEKRIFWGFVLFEDLSEERVFTDDEVDILRSAGFMLVNSITRHEREERIKAADEHTKLMLDATPLSCILWDSSLRAIECNTKAAELYGFSGKEECIVRVRECLPKYQPDGSISAEKSVFYLNKAFEEGRCHFDWTHITPAGELIPTTVTLVRVKYGDGYMVAGYAIDLRDRRLLLSEIDRQNALLQAVNRLSSIILSSKPHTFDNDILRAMQIIAGAVNVDRVYLCKNHEKDGRYYYTQFREWPGGRPSSEDGMTKTTALSNHWYRRLAQNECVSGGVGDVPPDLRERLTARGVKSVIVVPVFLYGEFWGFVGFEDRKAERHFHENEENILRASSELLAEAFVRHNMEENLRNSSIDLQQALAEAKAANSAKSVFLSHMSHEMRTPLNAVIGMTAIGKKADDNERKNYALDQIGEASAHLLGIINDILDMSKIEAGKLSLSPVEFNLDRMLQKVITVVKSRMNEKNQHFTVSIGDDVPRFMRGDDQRISQVITNLLSNATKFTPENGKIYLNIDSVKIDSVKNEGNENEIRVEVADSGIGISPEQQATLFRPFMQADSGITREYGGTGLGLSIAKRLVELMDGSIWVESELGQGAHFVFTVKLEAAGNNLKSLLNPGIRWDKVRILAADSSEKVRQSFQDSFERLSIPGVTAADGGAAWRIIEENSAFDVCFIDRALTDAEKSDTEKRDAEKSDAEKNDVENNDAEKNDADLIRRIKSHTPKRCQVVLVSFADGEQLQEAVRDSGADRGLTKPFFASGLANCLNNCLAEWDVNHQNDAGNEFAGKAVLLAEDIEINQEIIISLLDGTGILIDCVENGKEALTRMEAEPDKYDLIFMDMQMPVMDGLEATSRIRQLPARRCKQIPIIAMTANVFKTDVERCISAGMNDHIGKPIDIEDMVKKLRIYLRG